MSFSAFSVLRQVVYMDFASLFLLCLWEDSAAALLPRPDLPTMAPIGCQGSNQQQGIYRAESSCQRQKVRRMGSAHSKTVRSYSAVERRRVAASARGTTCSSRVFRFLKRSWMSPLWSRSSLMV